MPLHNIRVIRKIDTGHRVVGHSGKCRFLHGHTYTITVLLGADDLTDLGMVADFGIVKEIIDRWDHKMVLWEEDRLRFGVDESPDMQVIGMPAPLADDSIGESMLGVVRVPFNPTAENMARHLAEEMLKLPDIIYADVRVSETDSTTASFTAKNGF